MLVTGRSLHNNNTGFLELQLPFSWCWGWREGSRYADEFLQLPGLGEGWEPGWEPSALWTDACRVDLAQLIFLGSDLELGEGHGHPLSVHKNIDLMSLCVG